MEIIYDIFLLVNVPIIFWALLIGIGALMKGWPKMFDKEDKIIKTIFMLYVKFISILVQLRLYNHPIDNHPLDWLILPFHYLGRRD